MKELKSIITLYQSYRSTGEKCALAQVVRVQESSYRREGARMLVFESGTFKGGISGGCLEGDALNRSQMAILQNKPSLVTYDTSKDDENQIGVGLGCNGIIDVLITPLTESNKTIELLETCLASRQSHIIISVFSVSQHNPQISLGDTYYFNTLSKTITYCNHPEFSTLLSADAVQVLSRNKSSVCHYTLGDLKVSALIELIPPQYHIAIYGDNYDVYPILDMAQIMDWEVSLAGNVQKLKKSRLISVKNLYEKDRSERPTLDDRTAVVLMAHDYKTDLNNLKSALNSPAPYIAVLGPKKRFNKMEKQLMEEGTPLTALQLERIYAPCGLEIGANTPEEIAVSLFAEILCVFNQKEGGMLRQKNEPIHERF